MTTRPDKYTILHVINRAATWRRTRYQDGDHYRHFTEAALLEQACGVERDPVDVGEGMVAGRRSWTPSLVWNEKCCVGRGRRFDCARSWSRWSRKRRHSLYCRIGRRVYLCRHSEGRASDLALAVIRHWQMKRVGGVPTPIQV
jgi:hypothetical protein